MADGIAPAIDKVGAPEPTAPEAKAGAPTMDGSASTAAGLPNSANHEDKPGQPSEADKPEIPDGAGPAVGTPKPVEVKSVPETPVNGATPAGGTPKPELKIQDEPAAAKDSPKEPLVTTGITDPKPSPAASVPEADADAASGAAVTNGNNPAETTAPATHTGPETETVPATAPAPSAVANTRAMSGDAPLLASEPAKPSGPVAPAAPLEAATGDKRNLDREGVPPTAEMESPPPAKKAKVDDVSAETNGGKAVNGKPPARKPGRPRKDKTAAPQVGRTARKTRSQGPAEA
ncbi:hypothetical protein HRG_001081 [Hirsutella rhossiliensis]|uniref:Uncharacterized protein n=1 Tax=Hirsutella rhossiliensis TaxID=111463 RepID=A0A9P8N810_9HYPO|nr:uncharacterized protein HRG_01081 [Hirsutella rhossiliensis]KAH0968439.1 hypothetical protein HRG_01081 [Hirsutella rhossiliensis]